MHVISQEKVQIASKLIIKKYYCNSQANKLSLVKNPEHEETLKFPLMSPNNSETHYL